jgi:hypothetical protein
MKAGKIKLAYNVADILNCSGEGRGLRDILND